METKNAPAFNYAQFGAVGFLFYWMDHNPRTASLVVLTGNRFVDHHGCDGYVFKNERAARRYVLGDIHEKGSECQSACSDEDWINILQGIGMSKRGARETVEKGRWEKVARRMLDAYGPEYFLSTYSGNVAFMDDDDCSLLYY